MNFGDGLVGDDRDLRAGAQRLDARAQTREQPAADHNVISALAKRDLHHDRLGLAQRRGHDGFSVPRPRRCSASCGDDFIDNGVVRLVARLHDDVGLSIERFAQAAADP